MLTTVEKIVRLMDQIAPFETQDDWDNSGLLVGNRDKEALRVLLALDVTEEVVAEAIAEGYDTLLVHHPLIFKGLKQITQDTRLGKLLYKLIQNDIAVIAAHTNVDKSLLYGTNSYLAECYGIENPTVLNEVGYGLYGTLPEALSLDAFVEKTKAIFDTTTVKASNFTSSKVIKTVALCSGAASDFIGDAVRVGADVYVTGDLKYHEYQTAIGTRTMLVDVGHYESEKIYLNALLGHLKTLAEAQAYDLLFAVSQRETALIHTL
ncbi:Nif3-like dinuclear metal center hexameric protein [Fusibacter sp. JL298sf-3]